MNKDLTKPCRKCGVVDRLPSNGKCRPCATLYSSTYSRDPIKKRESSTKYRINNPDKVRESLAKWYNENREYKQNYALMKLYDITLEEFLDKSKQQNGCCVICETQTKLVVDHCHITGKIRGLLCNSCNPALGGFKDKIELLRKAIEYLEKFNQVALSHV